MFRNRTKHGSIRLSGCNHVLASARVNFCSAGMRVCISSHEHARTVLLNYSHKLTRTFSSTSQDGRDPEAAKLTEFGILSEATFRAGVSKRLASLRLSPWLSRPGTEIITEIVTSRQSESKRGDFPGRALPL